MCIAIITGQTYVMQQSTKKYFWIVLELIKDSDGKYKFKIKNERDK